MRRRRRKLATFFDDLDPTSEPETPGRSVADIEEEVRWLYGSDDRPWVIGYSGGKDSTCALQLIWSTLSGLPKKKRKKPVYVLSSDTLVETPVIVDYIDNTITNINAAAKAQSIPIEARKVVPDISDSSGLTCWGAATRPRPNGFVGVRSG